MTVAIVIPFAGDCPHRRRALSWVLDRYAEHHPGWTVTVGRHSGPWCKAAAVADGLRQTDADTLAIADADVWCDGIAEAADHCQTWAIPHGLVHRLSADSTEQVYDGVDWRGLPLSGDNPQDRRPYSGHPGGGIVVIRRDVYRSCPLDSRFVGWGGEDDAWALALHTLIGKPWRGDVDLVHLWHPAEPRRTRTIGNRTSHALLRRYRTARYHPNVMAGLVAEHATVAV